MMATFLFKFSACLTIFYLVYVLLLERQTVHRFKRFYLLGSLVLSLLIPQFTITRYVEPVVNAIETPLMELPSTMTVVEVPTEATPLFTTENILWTIYGIGVLLFSLRFLVNLYNMYRRISNHKHIIKKPFIYVLLSQCRIPHSFFKYLFFDKTSFETEAIPKEVLLHEQTHAEQLHSLDILILELLQIVFWFHPLIYLLKHHIKLNHEFLADEAVLNQGAEAKDYQNLLLQFSSNAHEYQLSSTINYSSFKKRFKVMKTQTSKTRFWLSTLLLLPIIAILFYSFAEHREVEKDKLKKRANTELNENSYDNIKFHSQTPVEVYLNKYSNYETLRIEEPHYIYKSADKQKEMEAMFSDLGGMYFRMSKENKTKVERPISPVRPYVKLTLNGKTYFKKRDELTSEERATLLPPPPPPPAPDVPKASKAGINGENVPPPSPPLRTKTPENSKGDQQSTEKQQAKKIQPIEIFIDKNDNVQLNGKRIKVEDINNEVTKLNQHLSVEDHRKYVIASIAIEKNKSSDLAKTIQTNLKEINIWSSGISYYENVTKSNLPKRSFNLYSGLTLEEAKVEEKKIFSDSINIEKEIDSINNSGGPWKINVASASYEFIDDDGNSTGKINLDPAEIATPPKSAYEYVKTLKNKEIQYIYNKRKVSYKEILEILEKNTNINMSTNIKNAKGTVKFWTKD